MITVIVRTSDREFRRTFADLNEALPFIAWWQNRALVIVDFSATRPPAPVADMAGVY